jgi:hypothetical protein
MAGSGCAGRLSYGLGIFLITSLARSTAAGEASPAPFHEGTSAARWLLLGRVVNLMPPHKEAGITDSAPEEESSDPGSDFGVLVTGRGELAAYRLSTKDRLWTRSFNLPCRSLVAVRGFVYAECDGQLRSFARGDGATKVLDRGPDVDQVVSGGGYLAVHHRSGVVAVFDGERQTVVARKPLAELLHAPAGGQLLVSPVVEGWCVLGFSRTGARRQVWAYKLGCYDWRLSRLWSKAISFDLPPEANTTDSDPLGAIRQDGPCRFVANDQPLRYPGRGRGKGIVVRWRDGAVEHFADHTFATIDQAGCERSTVPAVLNVFAMKVAPDPRQEEFPISSAVVAQDGHRAFALIMDGATRLAGVDLAAQKVLFVTAVPLGAAAQKLDIVGGYPVVRTRFLGNPRQYWRASIHDPETGRVLYEDERPVGQGSVPPSEN